MGLGLFCVSGYHHYHRRHLHSQVVFATFLFSLARFHFIDNNPYVYFLKPLLDIFVLPPRKKGVFFFGLAVGIECESGCWQNKKELWSLTQCLVVDEARGAYFLFPAYNL